MWQIKERDKQCGRQAGPASTAGHSKQISYGMRQ